MPNASRYLEPGYTYHLTHRCHDRRFLLRTVRERNDYREWLRHGARRYGVPVYNYSVTSNHVHVIVHVDNAAVTCSPETVPFSMRVFPARVAQPRRASNEEESV